MSGRPLVCRLEWRFSRILVAALIGLGLLAAVSLWLSALPRIPAALAAGAAAAYGLGLARREAQRSPCELTWSGPDSEALLDFGGRRQSWSATRVRLRGPLVSLSGVDRRGRRQRLHWWPDTLSAASRRTLRLAAGARNDTTISALTLSG